MKFALYTIGYSPHQRPLAEALVARLGEDNYRYVSVVPMCAERRSLGWGGDAEEKWHVGEWENRDETRKVLLSAQVLMSGMRDLPLMEARCNCGLTTIYCAERWLKPNKGILRLLWPPYFRMARRFVRLLRGRDRMFFFPMGIHAARDMARLCGLFAGDWRCLFKAPELGFEKRPGGRVFLAAKNAKTAKKERRYCLDKMRMWGYYVAPSKKNALPVQEPAKTKTPEEIKVLWVGRLLNLKRVDTIVRAVSAHADLKRVDTSLPRITLDIYGTGPEEARLMRMAKPHEDIIKFHPPVPIDEVRRLMRAHDVYVLASNGHEGWGAVVSEALEEGMKVLGTCEAGSSATMLPESCLFRAGDWRRLLRLLSAPVESVGIGRWSAHDAAGFLQGFMLDGKK